MTAKEINRKRIKYNNRSIKDSARAIEKKQCLECKREIQKARDAFDYTGMQVGTYLCRICYFKKLS